jgi:hypothetical protein
MIVDGLLLEIKSTATASRLGGEDFYQLAGYVLLDYDNRYAIGRVGFYLTRYGRLLTWSLDEFLDLFGSHRPLADLRTRCQAALAKTPVLPQP